MTPFTFVLARPGEAIQHAELDIRNPSLTSLGDLDADGHPELIVAAPRRTPQGSGQVWALSLRSGLPLWSVAGRDRSVRLGTAVIPLQDLDGDASEDILVAGWRIHGEADAYGGATFVVLSGRSGSILVAFELPIEYRCTGGLQIEDLDGDGAGEVALETPFGATILSVLSGAVVSRYSGWRDTAFSVLDGVGDLNGDGCTDLIVGEPGGFSGRCTVVDGRTGAMLWNVESESVRVFGCTFGAAVASPRVIPAMDGVSFAVTDPAILNASEGCAVLRIRTSDDPIVWRLEVQSIAGERWGTGVLVADDPGWCAGQPVVLVSGDLGRRIGVLALCWTCGRVVRRVEVPRPVGVSGTELHRLADLDCDGVADFAMGAAGRWEYQVGDHENALLVSGASLEPLGVVSPDLLRQGRRVAPLRR